MVNNVGFNQIQHGASHVDRSDVPQLFDNAFLYGHAKVTDTTNGNNTVVAKDKFTHVMVAHVMNENTYYRSLKDSAQSPTLFFLFAINIPSDVALPGVGKLTPDKAQSFTPLSTDVSMKNPPQFTYSVKVPAPRSGSIKAPDSQSTMVSRRSKATVVIYFPGIPEGKVNCDSSRQQQPSLIRNQELHAKTTVLFSF